MLTKPQPLAADPTARVTAFFTTIGATRMAGLPIVNPALRVEVVNFIPWEAGWLGVLVTPWCMNLLWMPGQQTTPLGQPGTKVNWRFPTTTCEFVVCQEAALGTYLSCSLFSPMAAFANQEDACITATAILNALRQSPTARPEDADRPPEPIPAQRGWSRRALLGKWFVNAT